MLSAALILAVMVIPFTSSVAREVLKAVPRDAARGGLRPRRDALGGDPGRAALRPHRDHRRDHARLRPRPRRDDGRDDGHRQQPAGHGLALRARSTRWPPSSPTSSPRRPTTSTCRALIEIGLVLFVITARHQRALAPADLERDRADGRGRGRRGRRPIAVAAEAGVNRDPAAASAVCRASSCSSAALAVVVALVPLAFIFFYVIQQGFSSLELGLLHEDAEARRRDGRRHGQRDRRDADPDRRSPRRSRSRSGSSRASTSSEYGKKPFALARALHRGRPERRSVDRHRDLRLRPRRAARASASRALAGGLALGFMMIPIITRTTEELLNLVPATPARGRARARRHARARGVLGDAAGGAARAS